MQRRELLRAFAAGAAVPLVGSALPAELMQWGREVHAANEVEQSTASVLSSTARATLTAACDRIIPADSTPGAVAAAAPAFIERMLSDWYDPSERERVFAGLDSLDAAARERHARPFAECAAADQDALLLALDREGRSHWFATVKYLTIWGYYTSEIGVVQELGQGRPSGRYDGCAPYTPRPRTA